MLALDASPRVHEELMESLKDNGSRIGFVYWPSPLGFVATLTTAQFKELQARRDVESIVDIEAQEEEPEPEDESMWAYFCGVKRPSAVRNAPPLPMRFPSAAGPSVASAVAPVAAPPVAAAPSARKELERLALLRFAVRLAPLTLDNVSAMRFLCGKGLRRLASPDTEKIDALAQSAVNMYKASLAWRAAERIDECLSEAPLAEEPEAALSSALVVRCLDGFDCSDRPILFFQPRDLNQAGLRAAGVSEKQLTRRYFRVMEQICALLNVAEEPGRGHLSIYDVGEMSVFGTFRTLSFWLALGRQLEANYPETLGQLVIVNAPAGSEWAFEQFKSHLAPASVHKVSMRSGDPRTALAGLLPDELIPPELKPRDASKMGSADAQAAELSGGQPLRPPPAQSGSAKLW